MIPHRALHDCVCMYRNKFNIGPSSVCMLVTSCGFDPSLLDITAGLTSGGTLLLPRPGGQMDPAYICGLVRNTPVTAILTGVPSLAQEYVNQMGLAPELKLWSLGGEPLPIPLVEQMQAVCPNMVGPINAYGPTEATIIATSYVCPRPTSHMFIGTPDDNMHAYVVDPMTLKLVPVGVPGELWLSGPRLAIGYADRPDLTAAAFVDNPFYEAVAPNLPLQLRSYYRRAYRTGDMVRWTYNGLIDYLGRIDRQVKVNGVRIELGEVEAALEKAPGVVRAAAAVLKDQSGRKALVGYVEATADAAAGVRAFCRSLLVPAMVPSIIVPLPALPLLPNGKLDLKALPEPDWSLASAADEYVAPTDAVEEGVASIWAQSLGLEDPIGIYTDFYRLGGTSLKAIALAAALKGAFDLPGSTAPLLNMSTVSEMAAYVRTNASAEAIQNAAANGPVAVSSSIIPQKWPDELRIPSAGQLQMYTLSQDVADASHYNESIKYTVEGQFDLSALEEGLNALVQRHEVFQCAYVQTAQAVMLKVIPSAHAVCEFKKLTGNQSETASEAKALCASFAKQPFDLARPPLLRALVVRRGPELHDLIIVLHHSVMDGWSMDIVGREVNELYNAALGKRPSTLVPLPLQYSDFAAWQRDWLASEAAKEQIEFWKETLAGVPELLQLPLDKLRPPQPSFVGDLLEWQLPEELVAGIYGLMRSSGVTLFSVMLTAYKVLLARYSAGEDIVVGSTFATRPPGTEPIVGYFLNLLPIRSQVESTSTFAQLIAAEQAAVRAAMANSDVPFQTIVEELQVPRSKAYNPLVQVRLFP